MTAEGRRSFDVFYRKILYGEDKRNPKPKSFKLAKNQIFQERGVIFDYYFDKKNNGTWVSWGDMFEKQQIPANAKVRLLMLVNRSVFIIKFQVSELIIQTNDSSYQRFFLKMCLNNLLPVLFVGPTGTGKSAVVLDHLITLPKEKFLPNVVNFSARTSAIMVSDLNTSDLSFWNTFSEFFFLRAMLSSGANRTYWQHHLSVEVELYILGVSEISDLSLKCARLILKATFLYKDKRVKSVTAGI